MSTHATAQLTGTRTYQCDATATAATPHGGRAYALLDGIGSTPAIRCWTRTAARRLATTAARHGDAETGLRHLYNRYATNPARRDPRRNLPAAAAVVAVHNPGQPLTIAWCGDVRAYLLTGTALARLTNDHNLRRVHPPRHGRPGGNRNIITSCLGAAWTDDETLNQCGHPIIETVTRPGRGRLLLVSDGAYEPLEDGGLDLADYLTGTPTVAARGFAQAAVDHAGPHVDNATVLIADLTA